MTKDKIIVKLNGGLGNQMFQWALARMIQVTTDMDVYLDMSYFDNKYARPYQLDVFKIEPKFVEDIWTKIQLFIIWKFRMFLRWEKVFGYIVFSEKQFNFDRNVQRVKPNTFIEGFFQSEMYFKCIEGVLHEDFKFAKLPDDNNRKVLSLINNAGTSVSLHIRRGDYVEKKRYKNTYAQCSLDYYMRAIKYFEKRFPEFTVFVFSDDMEWVKRNLKLPCKCVYVSHNKGDRGVEDLRLMSSCTHHIIANSTFSWWGAWLNPNENKIVIAPKKWFNDESIIQTDIIPEGWIQIDN